MNKQEQSMRIDKWLWAARFFKTRAAASQAINGGKVHINGERVKPARLVRPGDSLEITRGHQHLTLVVNDLNAQRRPFKEAQLLYTETEQSRVRREQDAEQRHMLNNSSPSSLRRPNKRDRRKLRQLTGKD